MKRYSFSTVLILTVLSFSAISDAAAQGSDSRKAFFENMKKLCGKTFEGATEFPKNLDHPMVGKKLLLVVNACGEKEVRILFQVEEDKSRTWILTLDEKGLLLKHDHRHADGTPDEITMYGGWSTAEGTGYRQQFPADSDTKKLLPEAATNVWMIEVDKEKQQLVYYLERHSEPRYRAVFNLNPVRK